MTTICFAGSQTNVWRLPSAQNHFEQEADDDDSGDDANGDNNDGDD